METRFYSDDRSCFKTSTYVGPGHESHIGKKKAMDSQTLKGAHRIRTECKAKFYIHSEGLSPSRLQEAIEFSSVNSPQFQHKTSKQSIAASPVSKHDQLQSQRASHAGGWPTSSLPAAAAADVSPHALHPQRHSAFPKSLSTKARAATRVRQRATAWPHMP